MSRFGNTFVSGSRFIFWSVAPFLLAGGVFFLGIAAHPIGDVGQGKQPQFAGAGLFFLAVLVFLYDPKRFWLVGRVVTGTVFLIYLAYLIYEWVWDSGDVGVGKHRSETTPLNATLGFLIIGLPCLWWTLFGRFTLRGDRTPSPTDETPIELE